MSCVSVTCIQGRQGGLIRKWGGDHMDSTKLQQSLNVLHDSHTTATSGITPLKQMVNVGSEFYMKTVVSVDATCTVYPHTAGQGSNISLCM